MADFENTTQKFGEQAKALPMGTMVRDIAMGIAEAQSQMDKSAVALMKEYGVKNIDLFGDGKKQVSLLELGFAPQFLFFQKVSIKLHMDLRFHAEEDTASKTSIGGNAALSGGKTTTTQPGATAETEEQKKARLDKEAAEDAAAMKTFEEKNPAATEEQKTAERNRLKDEREKKKQQGAGTSSTSDVKGSVAIAASYDTSEARKFSLDASMATEVIAELVSIPAPAKLTELIASRFSQGKAAA